MDFIQAANLKHYILQNFNVVLHIHDTCGGMYFSIDRPNEYVKEYILAYCRHLSVPVKVSDDEMSFFPEKEGESKDPDDYARIRIVFEPIKTRTAAYLDKSLVGVCEYSVKKDTWRIEHTWVEPVYRNKGLADRLVEKTVAEAEVRGIRVDAVCSYAIKWLQANRSYEDD